MKLYAGTSGYSYEEWKGTFYPQDLVKEDWLGFYSQRLNAVEINNTFYRMPKSAVVEKWAAQVGADFRFVLKASQRITHRARLRNVEDTLEYLWRAARHLGDRQGPVLFQLPPTFQKDVERLEEFLALVPDDFRAVMEFRHASWFDDDVYDVLRGHKAALCLGDDVDESLAFVATAPWGYLRMRRTGYSEEELVSWANRVCEQPWEEAYVFFKHEEAGLAPQVAERFSALIS